MPYLQIVFSPREREVDMLLLFEIYLKLAK